MLSLEILETVFLASYASGQRKTELINTAATRLDVLKFFLQVAWENNDMQDRVYIKVTTLVSDAGKMLAGWKRQVENKNSRGFAGEMKQ